ncbi:DHH family phosphoesterase [Xanthovirga aplysinae]|uniref:DHH family phosphoesterase n=1 Tax=Xanthovirga aplysinae TaxID=2529853 RepID=UPI0012BD0CE7|nr:bifunctional oligoribonuclease/PAP phosphatase NrnA [Xanthovirga aplysinae]MTI32404.1 bifunctional oligoribonuclease/PAP phosphatase NrnA [Xanthovirga aplysinae]
MQKLEEFKGLLASPKKIVITTHTKPDADALGSSLGLAGFLKKKGHEVVVITPTDYPEFLHWMEGNDEVIIFNEGNEKISGQCVEAADVIFCLDFSCLNRINELGEMVRHSSAKKVLIDHHLDPEPFADFEHWSTKAAATAELVYDLILDMGETHLINKDIAESLYAGIMTDTGSFKHSNTTQHVHLVVAQLIELGADIAKVSKLIYDNNSLNRVKFLGYCLSEKLVVNEEARVAYFALSARDLKRFQSRTGDTEGLVNYALSLKGVVMAAMIAEREEGIRISFRSVGDFAVNEFAKYHFGGGGHKNAAGGTSELSFQDTVDKFEKLLDEYKPILNACNQKIDLDA